MQMDATDGGLPYSYWKNMCPHYVVPGGPHKTPVTPQPKCARNSAIRVVKYLMNFLLMEGKYTH